MLKYVPSVPAVLLMCFTSIAAAADDILIADFEGQTYGDWKTTGEAFGPGPARGTLPGQMEVTGYLGKGLVNSYYKGDASTGTLTSPPFTVRRKYINFLIGGGMHPGRTCINLLIDGKVVRTAAGPNDRPGGSERLDWYSWDVREFAGKEAIIQIVDQETGGWGHINIDHIVQSDRRKGVAQTARDLRIDRDYLTFRFAAGQDGRARISLVVDGKAVRHAAGYGRARPSEYTWEVTRFKGRAAQVLIEELLTDGERCPLADSVALAGRPHGTLIVVDRFYEETYRPQFHFTPKKNWTNDPNGLVYYAGEYHLFFQHNPDGIDWGNMTWGHAVSPDLVHWKQLDHAIRPDKLGTIWSGSAVVDRDNTAGFQAGAEKPLVCMYTSAGKPFTQSIAYSNDRGRTWTKYKDNPVLGHVKAENRDPKVFWHAPTKKWMMALYLDGNDYALFGSADLKSWKKLSDVPMPGTSECPDFFPLAIDGDLKQTTWVFWGANGNYRLGALDGTTFRTETEPLRSLWGGNDYAAQTYSDIPADDGRRIQIAWMNGGKYPDMPFNQQMTFPRELTLRTTPEGVRLCMAPVREIANIRGKKHSWEALDLKPGDNPLVALEGELWDIDMDIDVGTAAEVVLTVRGEPIRYETRTRTLHCLGRSAELPLEAGKVRLRVLVDRTSIEIFAGGGRVTMCSCFLPDPSDRGLALEARGGKATVRSLTLFELKSAWRQ
jgi:sucrose-6-phosphate hydrolase SacC (GH32 family)